jgi:mercuric ion transport protein
VCADPIVLKRQRLIFWIVTVALLALLAVPWLAPFFL